MNKRARIKYLIAVIYTFAISACASSSNDANLENTPAVDKDEVSAVAIVDVRDSGDIKDLEDATDSEDAKGRGDSADIKTLTEIKSIPLICYDGLGTHSVYASFSVYDNGIIRERIDDQVFYIYTSDWKAQELIRF